MEAKPRGTVQSTAISEKVKKLDLERQDPDDFTLPDSSSKGPKILPPI